MIKLRPNRQILTLAALVLSLGASSPASASQELSKVRSTNDWPRIKQAANRLLKQNPQDVYARECLVEVNIQQGEYAEARKNLALLKGRMTAIGKFNYLGALIEFRTNNATAARDYIRHLTADDLKLPVIRNLNEEILFATDKSAWFNAIIKHRNFRHVDWYLSRGKTGDHTLASAELVRIINGPDALGVSPYLFAGMLLSKVPASALNADEKLLLAHSLAEQNRFEEAVSLCESAGSERPEKTLEVLHSIAGAGKGMPAKALPVLESIRPRLQTSARFWDTISFAYMANGKNDKALKTAEAAIQADPSEERLWLLYNIEASNVATKYRKKSLADQMITLERIIQKFPSERAFQERAKVWHELGMFDKEMDDLKRLVEMNPRGPQGKDYLIRKADLEYSTGDLRAAMDSVSQVLASDPENDHCLFLKDRIEFEMKRANIK